MHPTFTGDIARTRSAALQREATEARLVRAAREHRRSSRPQEQRTLNVALKHPRAKKLLVTATLFVCATGGVAVAAAAASPTTHSTPDSCIIRNGGDYNACNVGNTGRGDLPYARVTLPARRFTHGR